jgi:hypothetical protein
VPVRDHAFASPQAGQRAAKRAHASATGRDNARLAEVIRELEAEGL